MRIPYKIVTLDEANDLLDSTKPLSSDTETIGLYGKVRLLQLYQEGMEAVLIVEWPEPLAMTIFLNNYYSLWYNAHYDITTIQQQSETVWIPEDYDCLFLLARLHWADKLKFSLDDVLGYQLGFDPYARQHLQKKALQKSNWKADVLSDDQLVYAATDVYYMPELYDELQAHKEEQSYILDKSTLSSCMLLQWNGMKVNHRLLMERFGLNEARIVELDMPINVNSYQQVRPYIGSDESDDIGLAALSAAGNERAANVRETRKLIKQNSFIKKFDTDTNYIYGKFLPSARSGRLTSKDQNMQQIPRALKGCFGYEPDEGRILIYSDYAQLELRTICAIVNCTMMAEKFREGVDVHGFTAEMIFGANWTKDHRQISKTYNFNLLYGGGINMIQTILLKNTGLVQNDLETNKARKKWRTLWKEIYAWQERGISDWKKNRLGSTPLGRKYKAKMMTDQLNIENQGAGAEVAKLALHYLRDTLKDDKFKLVNFIHDSFIIDCPDDPEIYKPVALAVAEAMQLAWFEMSKLFKVKDLPMPVEVKVGYNWGDLENDKYEWKLDLQPYAMLEKAQ